MEPKKEPKKAAFVATAVAGFYANGFYRHPPLPGRQLRCRPVRKAHREKPENYRKTSSLVLSEIFWLFLCPGALFAPFKLQAEASFVFPFASSPAEVQEMKSPGAGFRAAEALTFPLPISVCLSLSY